MVYLFDQARKITKALKRIETSSAKLPALSGMLPNKRNRLLNSCRRPLRLTWRQLKYIRSDGTTRACQQAELLLANAKLT